MFHVKHFHPLLHRNMRQNVSRETFYKKRKSLAKRKMALNRDVFNILPDFAGKKHMKMFHTMFHTYIRSILSAR